MPRRGSLLYNTIINKIDKARLPSSRAAAFGRVAFVTALLCATASLPSFAEAKSATLSATGYSGTETLTGFPALVKLSASNDAYGFSYSDCVNGKDDLWFTDADGNLIPHDVDTWNASGDSYVWVRFPSLAKNAEIVMHWGATRTAERTCAPADTWAGYVGVWHMNETGTTAEPDKTANGLNAAPVLGSGGNSTSIDTATGQIGAGRAVTQGTMLKVTGHSVSDAKVFTISGWAKRTGTGSYPRIFVGNTDSDRAQWELYGQSDTELRIRGGTKELTGCSVNTGTAAGWHYLTVVFNGTTGTLYDKGASVNSGAINNATQGGFFSIGGWTGRSDRSFVGVFDEVRMYDGVASKDRVAADYKTMNEPTTFLTLSSGDMPAVSATLTHRWSFNGDLNDSVGGVNATIKHQTANATTVDGGTGVNIENGKAVLSGGAGAGFLNLGTGVLGTGNAATIEVWARREGNFNAWHYAISYHKPDVGKCYTICSGRHSDVRRSNVAMTDSTGGGDDKLVGHPIGVTYHYSVTFTSSAVRTMVRNAETGALVAENTCVPSNWSLASAAADGWALTLGDNPWANSTMVANYSFDEARVWDGVLSDEQLTANALAGPDSVVGGGESGIVVAADNTLPVDGPGGYGFYTPGAVTLEAGAKIRFDTASWTNYSNRAVMRFKAGSFSLPDGASSVLDFVELTDSTHYTATLEDATTIKVALNSSIPATSTWKGGTPTAESLALASSWTSVDADGNAIDAAPGYGTTIVIPVGSTTFTVPAGYTPEWGRVLFGAGHPATLCGRIASAPDAAKVEYIDAALSSYTALGEIALMSINATGNDNQAGSFVKDYLEDSQLRFDGWFKVEAAQAGWWAIDCHFDDMFALLVDGERILQNPRWDPAIKSGAYVAEGWHRFTLVCGDTSGGYGAGDYSNHPMRISVNGSSSYIYFDGLTSGSGSSIVTLDADCDWSALGPLALGTGAVIDLNGHNLKLDDMTADYLGAIVTNTSSTTSTMIFDKEPFSSKANLQGIIRGVGVNIDLVQDGAKSATWTGGGNDGDPANPDNWEVKLGSLVLGNTVPDFRTAVVMQGQNINMQLAGTALSCSSFQIGNCMFTADCDWRGLSVTPSISGTADLAGHNLYLNTLTANSGSAFANTSATESQVRFPVNVVNGAVTDNGLIANMGNLSVASNVRIVMVNDGSVSASDNSPIGYLSGGTSGFVQTGEGSIFLSPNKALALGKTSGGTALFRIESGTVLFGGISAQSVAGAHALVELAGGELQTGWFDLGCSSSGSATINQTGGTFTGTGNIWIGRSNGGTGVYNLTGGTFGTGVVLGQVSGTTGRMTVGGAGVAYLSRGCTVGAEGVGYLTITNGGTVTATSFVVGGNNAAKSGNSAGTVTLTGGELNVTGNNGLIVGQYKRSTLDIGGDGVVNAPSGVKLGVSTNYVNSGGTLILRENGVLNTSKIEKGVAAASAEFYGGTIAITNVSAGSEASLFTGFNSLTFGDGGLTIDTAGHNAAMAVPGTVTAGSGSALVKAGAGTLTMDVLPSIENVAVSNGTFAVASAAPGEVVVPGLLHRWSFNGETDEANLADSVGGAVGAKIGEAVTFENGEVVMSGDGNSTGSLNLGTGLLGTGEGTTIEIWATRTDVKSNARVFDYGTDENNFFMLAWNTASEGEIDFRVRKNGGGQLGHNGGVPWTTGEKCHVFITFKTRDDGSGKPRIGWFAYDPATGRRLNADEFDINSADLTLSDLANANFYLGHSQFTGHDDANARYDEVRIWDSVLTQGAMERSVALGPDAAAAQLADVAQLAASDNTSLAVAPGATLDIAGASVFRTAVSGGGRVTGGTLTATGEFRAKLGECLVVDGGTFNIDGAKVVFSAEDLATLETSRKSYTLARAANGGRIVGSPLQPATDAQLPTGWHVVATSGSVRLFKGGMTLFLR